eukprot:CAMPEP_0206264516 /NCGR_PEP_ID=MMETSP0047_2-20121206/29449_1 /ASSEMBLY_ACC=CAM_ASM_000192 /TAXON_ID=195065 /ORGANISM="Chroomonas mesostigmatica_cf, Strain CCMP1168" /LENGTH=79 /DNA_ID=CAMNT_0053692241 /DNA_START=55 /DNA_END=291 /DNA_ORIENTATION=-
MYHPGSSSASLINSVSPFLKLNSSELVCAKSYSATPRENPAGGAPPEDLPEAAVEPEFFDSPEPPRTSTCVAGMMPLRP